MFTVINAEAMPIPVSEQILDAIQAVARSGRCNMADWRCVHAALLDDDRCDAADWLESNVSTYLRGLYQGFHAPGEIAREGGSDSQ